MFDKKDEKKDKNVDSNKPIIDDKTKTGDEGEIKDASKPDDKEKIDPPVVEEEIEEIGDLAKMSPVGVDPFTLISRDENDVELKAVQIGQKGCIVAYEKGICFVPGAVIQQSGENNCLA